MSTLLFGIPVPEGAAKVEIRPILGRGNSLALYYGPIGDGAADTDIVMTVSRNSSFWEYIDQKGLEPDDDGTFSWRLRIVFISASAVASETFTTPEPVEFFRAKSKKAAVSDAEDAIARITTAAMGAIRDVGAAATNVLREANAPLTAAITAVKDMQQAELDWRNSAMRTIGRQGDQLQQMQARPAAESENPFQILAFFRDLKGALKN